MYNEKLKNEYLQYCKDVNDYSPATIDNIVICFTRIEKFEEKVNLDVYQMDHNYILKMFSELGINDIGTIRGFHSILKAYINFCIIHVGGFKINPLNKKLRPNDIFALFQQEDSIGEGYFKKDEMDEMLQEILSYENKAVSIYLYCLVSLVYNGVCKSMGDVLSLTDEDIDKDLCTINNIEVDEDLINKLEVVKIIESFGVNNRGETILNCKLNDKSIFRYYSKDNTFKAFNGDIVMRLFRKITGKKYRLTNIYYSGLVHFIYSKYTEDGGVNFISDLQSSELDDKFQIWLFEKGKTMTLSKFKFKCLPFISKCI